MSGKIPVGATIARAYRFAFANSLNNLGAIWVPALLLWVAGYFLLVRSNIATQLFSGDPQTVRSIFPTMLAIWVLTFVLLNCQIAALTKEALGHRTGNPFLQFPFGAPMWRLLLTNLVFVLAMIAIYIAMLLVTLAGGLLLGLLAAFVSGKGAVLVAGFGGALGVIVIFCGAIYLAVRLSFLIAPVAVAERQISLIRAWLLTRGNFWRIFVILLSVLIPFLLVECAYIYAMYGWELLPPAGARANPAALAQWQQHQRELALASMLRMQHYWYIAFPLGLLFALILYGLFAGISAFSYQSLVKPVADSHDPV